MRASAPCCGHESCPCFLLKWQTAKDVEIVLSSRRVVDDTVKLISAWLAGVLLLAGVVGILDLGRPDVFLEATRPDFPKRFLWVLAGIHNAGGPIGWGADRRSPQKGCETLLVFDLVEFCPVLGFKPDIGNGMGTGSKAVFKTVAEKGGPVLVLGKSGMKRRTKKPT